MAHDKPEVSLVRINDWTWWEEKIRRGAGRGLVESAKSPTSRKEREKWGTRPTMNKMGEQEVEACGTHSPKPRRVGQPSVGMVQAK